MVTPHPEDETRAIAAGELEPFTTPANLRWQAVEAMMTQPPNYLGDGGALRVRAPTGPAEGPSWAPRAVQAATEPALPQSLPSLQSIKQTVLSWFGADAPQARGGPPSDGGGESRAEEAPVEESAEETSTAPARLIVRVLDEKRRPVESAEVAVDGANSGATNAEGKLEVGEVAAGPHEIGAAMNGLVFPSRQHRLRAGETHTIDVEIHWVPDLPKTDYRSGRHHFTLESKAHEVTISSDLEYEKGWGASVVSLGAAVPAETGGLLDGTFTWAGYRWMKKSGLTSKFWDGAAWQNLPAGFSLIDANNFCVGFYKSGDKFVCQYGGEWPEQFTDWDIAAAPNAQKLQQWKTNIETTWSSVFDLAPTATCPAGAKCCRYREKASVEFVHKTPFVASTLIIANGNIRSNDSLWFIGEPRLATAAHEFGHHLGNPDEYAGARVDTSLNDDGAVNGIDANSIMGQNLSTVKVRHFRTVAKHLSNMVKTEVGKTRAFGAVAKT